MAQLGILKQAGPLLLGRAGATVLGFALPLVLTRLLPQTEFGTYKQVWLVVTTGYFMLQLGMSGSLYYFVPRRDGRAQAWLTQSVASVSMLGALCGAGLWMARFAIARQFGNPDLATFALPMALIAFTMIATSPIEVQLTAEGKVGAAAWVIFLSDAVRVAASVVPLLLGWGLHGFFWAYVLHGALRMVLQAVMVLRNGGPSFDFALLREQIAYALPFGGAVLLDIPQRTFHQWAVGSAVDAAAFAIYAQGCFQVPIVNLLYLPISDVLQVKLAEPGGRAQGVQLFHDANLRLAALFFPFTAGMVAAAALFVPALFTHTYDASVPIFRVAILLTPLSALPLDGTLRALGRTKYLFHIFLVRLVVTVPSVLIGLRLFGMTGAIGGHTLAEAAVRIVMLERVRRELGTSWRGILPWGQLSLLATASLVASVPALVVSRWAAESPRPFAALCLAGAAYAVVYLTALALAPGEGGGLQRVRRALLGAPAPMAG
ncbi:MAG: polysaccharide biosynthesis protein [Deltaproteobacteria bacterium]|nr:MAG: polysaccharide biosynthesis protein [Deltaproteobacteria bacterium]